MTLDSTHLLSAHAYDPYLRSDEAGIVPAHLTGANTALDTYLGGEPLTAEVLSEIVVAGCRALARQNADATVLALQDTRDALALERDTLRRELDAAKSSMTTEVATTANRVTEHANAVLGTMSAKVVEVTSGLPAHTRDTVAPLLDSLLQQFSSGLLAASKQMLDVSNPNSVTNGLAVSVDRAMTTHTERVSARLGELEHVSASRTPAPRNGRSPLPKVSISRMPWKSPSGSTRSLQGWCSCQRVAKRVL